MSGQSDKSRVQHKNIALGAVIHCFLSFCFTVSELVDPHGKTQQCSSRSPAPAKQASAEGTEVGRLLGFVTGRSLDTVCLHLLTLGL